MNPSLFGPFIRKERAKKNMTQRELAEKLNVSVAAVSKWERSKCLPDIEKINDIAEVLELTVLEVLACERKPDRESTKYESSAVYKKTIDTAHKQHLRKIRTFAIAAICAVLFVIGIYFFPIYHIAQAWFPSYYDTGEISMLAYIGSRDDRDAAKEILKLAEKAFSDTTSTDREASEKYGLLSRYAITTNYGADAERHIKRLLGGVFVSKEAIGENGIVLGSGDYWSRVNRSTFFGGLMRRTSETNYQETLREIGSRAGDMVEEIYDDLQEHKDQLRFIDSDRRNALAKQVQRVV